MMQSFLEAVGGRGMGALELVAMDMKARGMYVCRTLSFSGLLLFKMEDNTKEKKETAVKERNNNERKKQQQKKDRNKKKREGTKGRRRLMSRLPGITSTDPVQTRAA